ncbi:MAG: (d)CMP kinase [Oscillospiraceae bacterium]|jgi:cytidylate kinase|nr:(d)CMP kinase [Oscillospiraceae bacterium]
MINIAIDGPAGAGKSCAAKLVAERIGALYLDTGAMYRAFALAMIRRGADLTNAEAAAELVGKVDIDVGISGGTQHTFINGEDVTDELRSVEVSAGASAAGLVPEVREYMQAKQREIAGTYDVVLDGRDIGTKVLPNTPHKFFLTASAEVRAKRRFDEMHKENRPPFDEVLSAIIARDEQDMNRAADPLRPASDAIIIDTSDMTLNEVVHTILESVISVGR